VKVSKKILAILAVIGVAFNVGAAEATGINDVTENSPIVLRQNSVAQFQIPGQASENVQPLYHYSHSSHSSHGSHSSHYSSSY